MGEVVDFIVISGREAGATIWRKSKKGFQFFLEEKIVREHPIFLEEKIVREHPIFSGEKIVREQTIFTCDQLCVKKNDALYDGIAVYFSWIFVFWRRPYDGCVWMRNVCENENGRRRGRSWYR